MDNKKTLELIKLSAIGCIKPDDLKELHTLMVEDENFPWKELGEFQNLTAVLPSSLVIETPSWELKDKVARKLYKLRDEIKPQQEEVEQVEEPIEAPEAVLEETGNVTDIEDGEVNFDESDLSGIKFEEQQGEDLAGEKPPIPEAIHQPVVEKELIEKTVKEFINSHNRNEHGAVQKSNQKTLFISIALFIISILLIVFMYFKFSGDADTMQEDLEKIKDRLNISILHPVTNSDSRSS